MRLVTQQHRKQHLKSILNSASSLAETTTNTDWSSNEDIIKSLNKIIITVTSFIQNISLVLTQNETHNVDLN